VAANLGAVLDVGLSLAYSLLTGFIVYQYADVRAAYPASMTGRALALFTMAMFLGVALMQWATGAVATAASGWHVPTYAAVMGTMLAAGAAAFAWLPQPPKQPQAPAQS